MSVPRHSENGVPVSIDQVNSYSCSLTHGYEGTNCESVKLVYQIIHDDKTISDSTTKLLLLLLLLLLLI